MEALSGMNGPLCLFGAHWSRPENTSELSHEVRTRDTPWRQADTAKVWACAAHPLQEDCVCWHRRKDKPEAGENSLFSSCRSLDALSLAGPCSLYFIFFQAKGQSLTDQTLTEYLLAPSNSHIWHTCNNCRPQYWTVKKCVTQGLFSAAGFANTDVTQTWSRLKSRRSSLKRILTTKKTIKT